MGTQGTLPEWIVANVSRFKDRESLVRGVQKHSPASTRKTIMNRINEMVKDGRLPASYASSGSAPKVSSPSKTRPTKNGGKKVPRRFRMAIDLNTVKNEWDDEGKIQEGLENLGGQVIKDNDFRTELGIAHDRWKMISTSEKYTDNKIELKGKQHRGTFWGQQKVIAELRKAVDMV